MRIFFGKVSVSHEANQLLPTFFYFAICFGGTGKKARETYWSTESLLSRKVLLIVTLGVVVVVVCVVLSV